MNPEEEWSPNWTNSELSLHSSYLNYECNCEILMSEEVSALCCALDELLLGKMEEDWSMGFVEPDIMFRSRIAKRLYDIPGKVVYRNGYEDAGIYVDMYIKIWCEDGLSSNTFSMVLDRPEIEAFCIYLKTVVAELSEDAPIVKELVVKGMLIPE